jgi:hypothetical protein
VELGSKENRTSKRVESGKKSGKVCRQNGWKGRVQNTNRMLKKKEIIRQTDMKKWKD